jgi:RNA polymerase sigma-70 factor (ECF subfamily)
VSERRRSEFEQLILPHLGAAYGLARWLLRHPQDAEDAVQESVLRAFRAFHDFAGGSPQAWLLAIVRNTCLTAIERRRAEGKVVVLADAAPAHEPARSLASDPFPAPEAAVIAAEERREVHAAIAALPVQFREVLVLREFHEHSYREIAEIVGAPVGTVMSRLARARERLAAALGAKSTTSENGTTS